MKKLKTDAPLFDTKALKWSYRIAGDAIAAVYVRPDGRVACERATNMGQEIEVVVAAETHCNRPHGQPGDPTYVRRIVLGIPRTGPHAGKAFPLSMACYSALQCEARALEIVAGWQMWPKRQGAR